MELKDIFEKAYKLMDERIIDGDCGKLCNYHCCRDFDIDGSKLGIYLYPLEFEIMQKNKIKDYEVHNSKNYEMPPKTKKLFYIFCDDKCVRPLQCRTYPFEPHIEGGELFLVIEKDQLHECPLLERKDIWRWEFVNGIYQGWKLLIEDTKIKYYIKKTSESRIEEGNVLEKYKYKELEKVFKR